MRLILTLCLAAVLGACGGGGDGDPCAKGRPAFGQADQAKWDAECRVEPTKP